MNESNKNTPIPDTAENNQADVGGSDLRLVSCLLNNTLPSALGAIIIGAMIDPLLSIGHPKMAILAGIGAGLSLGWWAGMAAIVFVSRSSTNAIVEPRRGKAEKRSDGGFGVGSYALLCFFISSVDASAASSPLDQIPSPSASCLVCLGLVGVLGALFGAWMNPTQPDRIPSKKAKANQPLYGEKTHPKKRECMKTTDSSTSFAQENHDGNT